MTTPNSLIAAPPQPNGTAVTIEAPSPLDALADSYDIQDVPADIKIPEPKPDPKPGASPVPAKDVTPAPSVPTQKHPTSLLKRATDLGIHPLMIDRLDTSELTDYVFEQMQEKLAAQAENSRAATAQQPQPQVAAAATAQVPAEPQEPSWDWGEHQAYDEMGNPVEGKKMKYTDDMLNPALAHHIKTQAKRIEKLERFIGQMEEQAVTHKESQIERDFDQAFSLFPDVFGSGNATAVRDKTDLMERRKVTYAAVRAMFRTMPKEVAAQMSIRDGVVAMAKSLFGKDPSVAAAATPPNPNHPGQKYAGAGLAQPTQRQPSELPLGDARAKEEVKAWWNENKENGTPQGGATTLDEFF